MPKTTLRKNRSKLLHKKRNTKRNLQYTIQNVRTCGGSRSIKIMSFNVLAQLATSHYYKTSGLSNHIKKLDNNVLPFTNEQSKQIRIWQPKNPPIYEHFVDTARRFEKIKMIINSEKPDIILFQEFDNYLYTYLLKELIGYQGKYGFPPLQKDSYDLFREFGAAIFVKKDTLQIMDWLPLDYLSYGLFEHKKNTLPTSFPELLNALKYPVTIGIDTKTTLTKDSTDVTTTTFKISDDFFHLDKTDTFKFKYNTKDINSYDKKKQQEVETKDDLFGKKTVLYARLKLLSSESDGFIDVMSVHLSGDDSKQDKPEPKKTRMLQFMAEFYSKLEICEQKPLLTVIGGDFNCSQPLSDGDATSKLCMNNNESNGIENLLTGFNRLTQPKPMATTDSYDYSEKRDGAWIDHMFFKYHDNRQTVPTLNVFADDLKTGHERIFLHDNKNEPDELLASDHKPIWAQFEL
jgi:exonuclease III